MFLKQKKGANKQFFIMAELLFAAVIIISLFFFVNSKVNSTTLEKNYLARDIALLMEAIYASPGDLEYVYPVNYEFSIRIGSSKVGVWDKGAASYGYNRDEAVEQEPADFNFRFTDKKMEEKKIIFAKKDDKLRISCSGCEATTEIK